MSILGDELIQGTTYLAFFFDDLNWLNFFSNSLDKPVVFLNLFRNN